MGFSNEFIQKNKEMANRLKMPSLGHLWLLAVYLHESGGKPDAVNPYNGASGLIQFVGKTAKGLGYTLEQIRAMGAVQQLALIELYMKGYAGKLLKPSDVAMVVFWPVAVGKALDYLIADKGSAYDGNAALDVNKDHKIIVAEYMGRLEKYGKKVGVEMDSVASYLSRTSAAHSMNDLLMIASDILRENSSSQAIRETFTAYMATIAKTMQKDGLTPSSPVVLRLPDGTSINYSDLLEAKIRGAFQRTRDYSPSVKDYVETAIQTSKDVVQAGEKAVEKATNIAPYALPILLIVGGLFAYSKLR